MQLVGVDESDPCLRFVGQVEVLKRAFGGASTRAIVGEEQFEPSDVVLWHSRVERTDERRISLREDLAQNRLALSFQLDPMLLNNLLQQGADEEEWQRSRSHVDESLVDLAEATG